MMKQTVATITLVMIITGAIMSYPVSAASCGGVETSIVGCAGSGGGSIWSLLEIVVNVLASLIGFVAVGGLVYGGLLYASAADDASQITKAKTTITNVVAGLVLFAGMYAFIQYLIPGGVFDRDYSTPVAKDAPKKNDGNSGSGASGGSSTADKNTLDFFLAQYNIRHAVSHGNCKDNLSKEQIECAMTRTKTHIRVIKGSQTSDKALGIVTLNEVSRPQYQAMKQNLPNYGFYPTMVPSYQGKAVMWDKNEFILENSGAISNVWKNNGDMGNAPWVRLKSKDTGQTVFVTSIHSPHNGFGTISKRVHNANRLVEWAQGKLGTSKQILAVVGGDFNDVADRGSRQRAYCILTSGPFRNTYDVKNGKKGRCPTNNATIGIDQLYVSSNANPEVKSFRYWDGLGTDHSPLIARIVIEKK